MAGGDRQHAYRCSYCGDWHNGHGGMRTDFDAVMADDAKRFRFGDLEGMIIREREALATAQTPTQRNYYETRIADFENELSDLLDEINALTLEGATNG